MSDMFYKHIFMADWKKRSASPEIVVTGMVVFEWSNDDKTFAEHWDNEESDDFAFAKKRQSDVPLTEEEKETLDMLMLRYEMTDHGGLTNGLVMVNMPVKMSCDQVESLLETLPEAKRKELISDNKIFPK